VIQSVPPPLEDEDEDVVDEGAVEGAVSMPFVEEASTAVKDLREKLGDDTTLFDEMVAAAEAAKKAQAQVKREEHKAMNETFGSGLEQEMKRKRAQQKEKNVIINAFKEQGNEAFRESKLEQAAELYTKGIKLCSGDKVLGSYDSEHVLYSNRALVNIKLERFDAALCDANKSLEINKMWTKSYVRKALALHKLGQDPESASCFELGLKRLKGKKEEKLLRQEYKKLLPEKYELFCMPMIGGKQPSSHVGGNENKNGTNSLEIPEVQEAMLNQLGSGEWANDNLVKLLLENPVLAKGLSDPRSQVLFKRLQEDPNAAMQEFGQDPQARLFIQEFMKTLGTHFTKMGEEQDKIASEAVQAPILTKEEAKMQREADKVLKNNEIRSVLGDPETRKVLEACGNPHMLAKYMADPTWGPKIRLLRDNGLVKFER